MSNKIDPMVDLMRAQSLNQEKSKTLLVFLTSYCSADELFNRGIHAGLRHLERMGEVDPLKAEQSADRRMEAQIIKKEVEQAGGND